MVNANVVISVSAVLVALILTIVVVMRQDGDPTSNYSVTVTGTYNSGGSSANADMYFCTGEDCSFHGHVSKGEFPGYYALVGFEADGKKFLTEHSIGKTFEFDSAGTLLSCHDAAALNSAALTSRIEGLTNAFQVGDKTFEFTDDNGVAGSYTMNTYSLNADPKSDGTPGAVGVTVPSVDECRAVDPNDNDETLNGIVSEATPDISGAGGAGRKLWGGGSMDGSTAAQMCSFGYDGGSSLPGGWNHWSDCITSNAVARFGYSYPTMVLSYAGTNDMWDALQDLKTWGHGSYHGGFYDYVMMTKSCVDSRVDLLRSWGIELDYIVGHSLGGAAATVYQQLSGNGAKVVTFGAPKTSKSTSCRSNGLRIFNEKDPVASNGLGILGGFNHDVTASRQAYESSYCSSSWWGMCTGWSSTYSTRGAACGQEAGGCSWFFDCVYNVGKHSLDTYRKHNLGGFGV